MEKSCSEAFLEPSLSMPRDPCGVKPPKTEAKLAPMVWGDEALVGPTRSTLYFLPYYLILHLYLMMCCILYAVLLYDCSGWINLSLMHHGLKAFLFPC